jgi:hypothetical protein
MFLKGASRAERRPGGVKEVNVGVFGQFLSEKVREVFL